MRKRHLPSVLVSLLTYNPGSRLQSVLNSILSQTYQNIRIKISDNGSTDGSFNDPNQLVHGISIKKNTNIGYGRAHNEIMQTATEDYILLLNDDIVIEKNYVSSCVDLMEKNPKVAVTAGKLFEVENLRNLHQRKRALDHYILTRYRKTKPFRKNGYKPTNKTLSGYSKQVSGVTGAALFLRLQSIQKFASEIFDNHFFMYFEDVDLCWRLSRLGYFSALNMTTSGYHLRSYSFRRRKNVPPALRRRVYLNRYYSIIKNENLMDFSLNIPFIIGNASTRNVKQHKRPRSEERASVSDIRQIYKPDTKNQSAIKT